MRRAFTIIEMLVVLAIIGILIGLVLPAIHKIRTTAGRLESFNNLRQITLATLDCANTRNQRLPELRESVFTAILPFIDQQAVYEIYQLKRPAPRRP